MGRPISLFSKEQSRQKASNDLSLLEIIVMYHMNALCVMLTIRENLISVRERSYSSGLSVSTLNAGSRAFSLGV